MVLFSSIGVLDSLVNIEDRGLSLVEAVKDGCGPPNAICDPHISMKGHLYTPVPEGRTPINTGSNCTSCIPTNTPTSPPPACLGRGTVGLKTNHFSQFFINLVERLFL